MATGDSLVKQQTRATQFARISRVLVAACLLYTGSTFDTAHANETIRFQVFPTQIELHGPHDRQGIVVQIANADGTTSDITDRAQFTLDSANIAQLRGHLLWPHSDGETVLHIRFNGESAEVPVQVDGMNEPPRLSFRHDVMPVFFRAGCNTGSCHGSARGKDGFMLSLFGYDPAGDYFRLTQEIVGRRIDLAVPEQSLLLEKSLGAVKHTGGKLFDAESEHYQTLLRWIDEGALDDEAGDAEVAGLEMLPKRIVFRSPQESQQAVVLAHYNDGSQRDVSHLAVYLTSNETIVTIDGSAKIEAAKRGAGHLFARFDKFTTGAEAIVLPGKSDFVWPEPEPHNYIDSLAFDKLRKLQIVPSDLCTDEQFLRRVYLDVVGRLPTPEQHERFIGNTDNDKRSRLVDELLKREEFADLWAAKWGELLRVRGDTNPGSGTAMKAAWNYYRWIHEQMAANTPLDEFVRRQLRASGSNFRDAESNYYNMLAQGQLNAQTLSEDTAQLLLGIRAQCAQCHNHPFDRWTMDDYYSWMSFFTGIRRKHGAEAREYYIYNDNQAEPAKHLLDGRSMPAEFLGGGPAAVAGGDPRRALADWVTSKDNRLFRRNLANRLWAHFFGRGIVDPIDDVRISNQPSNEELLEELGRRLAEEYRFDQKRLIRDICNSRTYQLSSTTNATNREDDANFSHSYVRRLRADVLLDAIAQAAGVEFKFRRHTAKRAVQLFEGAQKENYNQYFLNTFGQAQRKTVCACEDQTEANLSQALHLINGETVNRRALGDSKIIGDALRRKDPPESIIGQLYRRTLARLPTDLELAGLAETAAQATDEEERREIYDDIFWALLNCEEFLFNH